MKNIAKAIIAVMTEVKGIEKNLNVGTGSGSYKGVADKDVKQAVGHAMIKNGLCVIPIGIESDVKIERWTEETQYGIKQKQQVFTSANTKYLLLHDSGESLEFVGMGHGIDSQDKAAGKATTYALKYALLYLFMVPTGKIDDADIVPSEAIEVPKKIVRSGSIEVPNKDDKVWMTKAQFEKTSAGTPVQIENVLKLYNGKNGKAMKKEYQEALELILEEEKYG